MINVNSHCEALSFLPLAGERGEVGMASLSS